MATRTRIIGPISAYGIAKAHGYTGSEADFADEIANASINAQRAETAADKCEDLTASLPDDFTDVLNMITPNGYPESGTSVEYGTYLMNDGKLYRCFEAFTSTGNWAADSAAYLDQMDIGWALNSVAAMRAALRKMSLRLTGMEIVPFVSGVYKTNETARIGSPAENPGYVCAICPCVPGDVFYAKATKTISGTANVPWVYFDSEGNALGHASSSGSIDGIMIVPETSSSAVPAYFAVNNRLADNADDYYLIRCKTTLAARINNLEALRSNGAALLNYGNDEQTYSGNSDNWTGTVVRSGFRYVFNGTSQINGTPIKFCLTAPTIGSYISTWPSAWNGSGVEFKPGHKYRARMRYVSGTATTETTGGTENKAVNIQFRQSGSILGTYFTDDRTGEQIAEFEPNPLDYSVNVQTHLMVQVARSNSSPAAGETHGVTMNNYTIDVWLEDVTYSDKKYENVAPVETSPAKTNHAVGDLIVVGGNLYKCLVTITGGMTLTSGSAFRSIDSTILRLTSISEEIAALRT